jgi:membrane protein DedA with SNARE-associated domain
MGTLQFVMELLNHYGYIVLIIALMLELLAFPLPGEALMTYCGYIIYMKKMNWPISIIVAAFGAAAGITLSYFIGKALELGFFEKYGHYIHMDKKRLDKLSSWFEKYGNKLLIIAFFIPGVRHVTGYFSGITKVSYKKFAVNAYIGAFLWTATFISLGKVFGANWEKYHVLIKKYLILGSIIIAVIIIGVYLYRSFKDRIYSFLLKTLDNSLRLFHSLGRIKALMVGIAVLFLVFSALVMGIIQDYLAHEFNQFDEVSKYIIVHIFDTDWNYIMKLFKNISNTYVLLIVAAITAVWIIIKGINKYNEIKFLIVAFLGGVLLNNVLRIVFRRFGPSGTVYTFPSGQSLMVVVTYGFLVYMVIRYSRKAWINSVILSLYLFVSVTSGISMVYFNLQFPSDVAAGFEFGMVWLTLIIILLEIYRVLPKITYNKGGSSSS